MDHLSNALPWFENPWNLTEERAWQTLIELSILDIEVGFSSAAFPWVADGVTNAEWSILNALRYIATFDTETARLAVDFPWVTGKAAYTGDSPYGKRDTLQSLGTIAIHQPEIARNLAALPWLYDDLTVPEEFALFNLAEIASLDAEAAWWAANLDWLTDDVTEVERLDLRNIVDVARENIKSARNMLRLQFDGEPPIAPFEVPDDD